MKRKHETTVQDNSPAPFEIVWPDRLKFVPIAMVQISPKVLASSYRDDEQKNENTRGQYVIRYEGLPTTVSRYHNGCSSYACTLVQARMVIEDMARQLRPVKRATRIVEESDE